MNTTNQSTAALRNVTALVLAVVFSATCVMGAIAPATLQSAQTASLVAEAPVA
jgi:hypothetical protein